jgi:hypothetical protein
MTRASAEHPTIRETVVTHRGRTLAVAVHPYYLSIWAKGTRLRLVVPYDAILHLGYRILDRLNRDQKQKRPNAKAKREKSEVTKRKTADRGPRPDDPRGIVARVRQSMDEDTARAVRASQGDAYWDLVQATARMILEWAFWRWLGRRTHFIPWEAYQSLTVRADGLILDAGACAVAAAYQRLREADTGQRWPNVGETPKGWSAFLWHVTQELKTGNVLKGMRPDDTVEEAIARGNRTNA